MSRSGLERYGVIAPTVVRDYHQDGDLINCAECGQPVNASKGTQTIHKPEIVEDIDLQEIVTLGWSCDRHPSDVVLPQRCLDFDAPSFVDGWVGVRVRFADQVVRHVAVPAKELPSDFGGDDSEH